MNKKPLQTVISGSSRGLLKVYFYTGIVELLVVGTYILTFKLSSMLWGEIGFAEYSLVRRTLALIIPILFLGLEIEIPRRIAYANEANDLEQTQSFFLSGLILVSLMIVIAYALLVVFRQHFGALFFGNSDYAHLIKPLALVIIGFSLHSLCYAYFRGTLQINYANLIHSHTFVAIPLIAFFVFGSSLMSTLNAIGWLAILSSLVVLVMVLKKTALQNCFSLRNMKLLLKFGSMRMPGPVAIAALFTLPATLTSHASGILLGGYVAFGIATIGLISTMMSPVNIVLLPSACRMITNREYTHLKRHIFLLIGISLVISLAFITIIHVFSDLIVEVMIGMQSTEAVKFIRLCSYGALPYVFYMSVRSLIDASHENAVNTRNIIIAFAIFIATTAMLYMLNLNAYFLHSFIAALYVLGCLTMWEVWKIFAGESRVTASLDEAISEIAEQQKIFH